MNLCPFLTLYHGLLSACSTKPLDRILRLALLARVLVLYLNAKIRAVILILLNAIRVDCLPI